MLSYNAAATLLGLCNIPDVIQKQILLLFIGFGTHTSNMIKKQTEFTADCYTFNGYLVKSIVLENDTFTLWRLNVLLNGCKVFKKFTLKNLNVLHELRVAYFLDGTRERMANIMSLNETLKNRRDLELFEMFYGLDKYNWKKYPIGTQSSIIIHNAIENKIIKVIDPNPAIYYGIDDIDPEGKYY